KSPSEHERHGKAKRNPRNKDRQNPLRGMVGGHDCRADLDDEPRNYCIAHRDAIDLPLFQLTEERVHVRLRRPGRISYLTCDVEPASGLRQSRCPGERFSGATVGMRVRPLAEDHGCTKRRIRRGEQPTSDYRLLRIIQILSAFNCRKVSSNSRYMS